MNFQKNIMSVTGKVKKEDMGYCQCHDHLFIARGKSSHINPMLRIDDFDKTVTELHSYFNSGGRTIVDAQPIGCGRMSENLVRASKKSGVNIIASTGFHKLSFYPENHWIFTEDEDTLSDIYIDEIKKGMYLNTDIKLNKEKIEAKTGIIKTALDTCGINGDYEKVFTAAANAAVETKIPLLCHIESGSDAMMLANFFLSKGVKANSIIFCHLDRARYDFEYHKEIAEMGIYLEYDTIGRFKYHSDEDEIKLIAFMIENGYRNQMLVGLDTTRARLKSYGGEIGLTYLLDSFIPKMRSYGIDYTSIKDIMVNNPANALSK